VSVGAGGSAQTAALPSQRRPWLWTLPLLYMGLIFYLSAQPNPLPNLTALIWDKLLHSTEYAALGAMLFFAFRAVGVAGRWAMLLALVCASLYGATDEIHQSFVRNRSCDVLDWTADTTGALVGTAAAALVLRVTWSRASIRRARRGE
jgi:VanZ family protein